ncbi:ABC transporter substrate-binding protein [Rhodococcus sp. F64268]|uniref:ABC transporter substrate-binding protein n=1 Tax=Rhodococcus sp. F64268 TaxID=2926402 RepID=UPI001FF2BA91|nr:ABC transporter substrate-binding protein [Rhodococcus sp. F64268]MCK0090328.1 ABC transporter substrate-binding protein [Rhodococcus sp. F64268]
MRARAVPLRFLSAAAVTGLALVGCSTDTTDTVTDTAAPDGCITDFDPSVDYFPDKSEVVDAENFSITYENSYQVLTVDEPYPGAEPESYVLVKCGAPAPDLSDDLADAQQISVPVDSLYSGSTTHLPLVTELGVLDVLTGVSNGSYVSDTSVVDRIASGDVAEYAAGGTIDTEAVVVAAPDVVMTGGTDDPAYAQLREAGIGVVANAEWLEASPLGRAEWIKVMAALTGTEVRAAEVYDGIRSAYLEVADKAAGAEPAPVLLGGMSQGTWYMSSGGSYMGRLFSDAGATWPWQEVTSTGSLPLDFEAVVAESSDAPTWLVANSWTSIGDALADDERYGDLAAVGTGQVWNANKALGPGGGNDFYERGVLRPDLVLSDLVAVLHPELLPDHEGTFYQQLPA